MQLYYITLIEITQEATFSMDEAQHLMTATNMLRSEASLRLPDPTTVFNIILINSLQGFSINLEI